MNFLVSTIYDKKAGKCVKAEQTAQAAQPTEELAGYRQAIDEQDARLTQAFLRRMQIAAQIAAWKKQEGLPVRDTAREQQKIAALCADVPRELQPYLAALYTELFRLSRDYQQQLMNRIPPRGQA